MAEDHSSMLLYISIFLSSIQFAFSFSICWECHRVSCRFYMAISKRFSLTEKV